LTACALRTHFFHIGPSYRRVVLRHRGEMRVSGPITNVVLVHGGFVDG